MSALIWLGIGRVNPASGVSVFATRVHRLVFFGWIALLVFHSLGYSLLGIEFLEHFSFIGQFAEVERLQASASHSQYAAVYAEHILISFILSASCCVFVGLMWLRRLLIWMRLVPYREVEKRSAIIGLSVMGAVFLYVLHSESFSPFFDDDRRLRGAPLWWILLFTGALWPALFVVSHWAFYNPSRFNSLWKYGDGRE